MIIEFILYFNVTIIIFQNIEAAYRSRCFLGVQVLDKPEY